MASQPPPQGLKGEVVSLTDPRPDGTGVLGPGPGQQKFKGTRNLRVIAKICFNYNIGNIEIEIMIRTDLQKLKSFSSGF